MIRNFVHASLCVAILGNFIPRVRTATAQTLAAAPVLVSVTNSTRAIALDAVTHQPEPFAQTPPLPFGADPRTRVMLFATNLTLAAGETATAVTADAQTADNRTFALGVESVVPVPDQPWLTSVVIRLHDDLPYTGDVLVRISYRDVASNRVRIGLGRTGGGLPDDAGAQPTPGRQTNIVYLSDLQWLRAPNGWGAVERDRSNGEREPADGRPLKLGTRTYAKGLGTHSTSEIVYRIDGEYETLLADVGIDEEKPSSGSVTFEVWADDVKLYDSGVLTARSATQSARVDVRGKRELRLVVTDGGDGEGDDHADWADARLVRTGAAPAPVTTRQSFRGRARSIPGVIEAEDFDHGAAGVAYNDTTPGNFAPAPDNTARQNIYRANVDVDIALLRDRSDNFDGGYALSMNPAGEWTEYTVDVARAGRYIVEVAAASQGTGKVRLEFDGANKTGTISLPGTANYGHFRRTTKAVTLVAGRQTMRLVAEGGDTANRSGNIDRITFREAPPLLAREPGTGDAVRLLEQSTFGATPALTNLVKEIGAERFVDEQLALASSGGAYGDDFFRQAVHAPDQLRLRVAFALSQILVVSNLKIANDGAMRDYLRMLKANAFGNYRELLTDVTLHPAMGNFLDMVNNRKPDQVLGSKANVNYARETLELFTVGLYKLNLDGTRQTDADGQPIATYGEDEVAGAARAMTGWTYDVPFGTARADNRRPYYLKPMIGFETYHDQDSKKMLGGATLPAGQTIRKDLDDTLDAIFRDANVAPFISRQLIQHLVTSNPSPAYVERISRVFDDNGAGVKGDLRGVVRTILLDPEARGDSKPDAGYGKVREPVLFITNILRVMNGETDGLGLPDQSELMGQDVLNAPTVFNFYRPNTKLENSSLECPQCEILTTANVLNRHNFFNRIWRGNPLYTREGRTATTIDLRWLEDLAARDPAAMVEQLDLLLMAGNMTSEMRAAITRHVGTIAATSPLTRARAAAYLIVTSPQYQVAR